LAVLFSVGLVCQSAPCTVDAVSGEYAPGGALAAGGATGDGGATDGGVFGVYEVSKEEGAPAVVAGFEAAADLELLDLVCFISSSALTSRSSCSLN
jgi:hypothetical protein